MQLSYIERLVKGAADFGDGKIHIIVNNVRYGLSPPFGFGEIN
jgi:hypothetical protein